MGEEHTLTCSAGLADSPLRHDGRDSGRLHSASVSPIRKACLQKTSGQLWPTPIANDAEKRGVPKVGAGLAGAVHRQSIRTCEPSPENATQGLLFSPEDSPASRSVSPGSEQAREMTASSGRRWLPLLKLSGPLGSLARMCLESSRWNSTVVRLTWKLKATPSGRSLFQLAPLAPSTDETGCGFWPTARSRDWKGQTQRGQHAPMDGLPNAVAMYPTPDAGAAKGRGASSAESRTRLGGSLNPTWVEWLQGYPLGWTDCGDSETRSCRKLRRS